MTEKLRIPESTAVRMFPKLHLTAPGASKPESILTWRHLDCDGFGLAGPAEYKPSGLALGWGSWAAKSCGDAQVAAGAGPGGSSSSGAQELLHSVSPGMELHSKEAAALP